MIKLVAADMDGTLLNSKNEISAPVRDAVARLGEAGVRFTLATGRAIQGIEKYVDVLDGDLPVISCNGAVVLSSRSRKIISTESMSYRETLLLLRDGISLGAVVAVWAGGRLYSTQTGGAYSLFYKSLSNMDVYEIAELPEGEVTKMVWIMTPERVLELQASFTPPKGVQSKSSGENYLEFYSAKAGKGAALCALAKSYGIEMSEVMAIGDNFNDMDMLTCAGLGVAMDNAPDEVKAVADAVTLDNDHDGVAAAIEKYVLGALPDKK